MSSRRAQDLRVCGPWSSGDPVAPLQPDGHFGRGSAPDAPVNDVTPVTSTSPMCDPTRLRPDDAGEVATPMAQSTPGTLGSPHVWRTAVTAWVRVPHRHRRGRHRRVGRIGASAGVDDRSRRTACGVVSRLVGQRLVPRHRAVRIRAGGRHQPRPLHEFCLLPGPADDHAHRDLDRHEPVRLGSRRLTASGSWRGSSRSVAS